MGMFEHFCNGNFALHVFSLLCISQNCFLNHLPNTLQDEAFREQIKRSSPTFMAYVSPVWRFVTLYTYKDIACCHRKIFVPKSGHTRALKRNGFHQFITSAKLPFPIFAIVSKSSTENCLYVRFG